MDLHTNLKQLPATKPKALSCSDSTPNTFTAPMQLNDSLLCKPKGTSGSDIVVDGLLKHFALKDMPAEVFAQIMSYLSYDELSRARGVCRTFDHVAKQILNAGFVKSERFHAKILHRVKSQLPRRESERRTHELARHADILTAIETRLSLLSMTFKKFIDAGYCCFIPGKVLDEIFRVLRLISAMPKGDNAPRSHEVLRELRDISSMAMEYFDEHLMPFYKDKPASSSFMSCANAGNLFVLGSSSPNSCSSSSASSWLLFNATPSIDDNNSSVVKFGGNFLSSEDGNSVVRRPATKKAKESADVKRVKELERQMHSQRIQMSVYRKELSYNQSSVKRLQEKIMIQNRQILLQGRRLESMNRKLLEHEGRFVELTADIRNNNSTNPDLSMSFKRPLDVDVDDQPRTKVKKVEESSDGQQRKQHYSLRSRRVK